jgi:ABC-type glutathione transport system ATPase component
LSTVTSADQILVLHAGKVAEAGTHHELLAMKGRYANMWKKQIRAERAFEAASQMVAKANALQKAAMERPGSSGNEGGPSEDVSENEADNRSSTTLAPSLSTKAVIKTAENLRADVSNLEESLMLEDNKSDEFEVDQERSADGNRGSSTASDTDYKPAEEDNKPIPAETENSKTADHS